MPYLPTICHTAPLFHFFRLQNDELEIPEPPASDLKVTHLILVL